MASTKGKSRPALTLYESMPPSKNVFLSNRLIIYTLKLHHIDCDVEFVAPNVITVPSDAIRNRQASLLLSSIAEKCWNELMHAQSQVSQSLPDTGIISTSDLGDDHIHFRNKKEVGIRLASCVIEWADRQIQKSKKR